MEIFPIDVLAMQSRLDELRAGALENEARMVKAQEKIDRERRDVFLAQLREAQKRTTYAEARFRRLLWWAGAAIALETTGLLLLLWKVTR